MLAQQHIDNLTGLVNSSEGVPPAAADLEQGLVHSPCPSDRMAMPAHGIDEPRRERLDPVIDRARVDRDAPLSQPLGKIGVAQAEA